MYLRAYLFLNSNRPLAIVISFLCPSSPWMIGRILVLLSRHPSICLKVPLSAKFNIAYTFNSYKTCRPYLVCTQVFQALSNDLTRDTDPVTPDKLIVGMGFLKHIRRFPNIKQTSMATGCHWEQQNHKEEGESNRGEKQKKNCLVCYLWRERIPTRAGKHRKRQGEQTKSYYYIERLCTKEKNELVVKIAMRERQQWDNNIQGEFNTSHNATYICPRVHNSVNWNHAAWKSYRRHVHLIVDLRIHSISKNLWKYQ